MGDRALPCTPAEVYYTAFAAPDWRGGIRVGARPHELVDTMIALDSE